MSIPGPMPAMMLPSGEAKKSADYAIELIFPTNISTADRRYYSNVPGADGTFQAGFISVSRLPVRKYKMSPAERRTFSLQYY